MSAVGSAARHLDVSSLRGLWRPVGGRLEAGSKRTRTWAEGIRARWHDNGVIVDYMQAMELAAELAWNDARSQGGSLESDSFYDGIQAALVEFLADRQLPQALDGSSPFGLGRKQAWAILSAMTLGVGIGLCPPPVVLPELGRDRQFAPGWVGPFGTTAVREGAFDASDTLRFRWREASESPWDDSGHATGSRPIRWSDVNWVRLMSLPSLLPKVAEQYSRLPGSTELDVVYGTLTGADGPGAEVFGLVSTGAYSGEQWLEMFRDAGVRIKPCAPSSPVSTAFAGGEKPATSPEGPPPSATSKPDEPCPEASVLARSGRLPASRRGRAERRSP